MGQMKNPMALQVVPEDVKLSLGESRTPSKYFSFWHWFVDRTLHHDDVSNHIKSKSFATYFWILLGPSERFLQHVSNPMALWW